MLLAGVLEAIPKELPVPVGGLPVGKFKAQENEKEPKKTVKTANQMNFEEVNLIKLSLG